MRVHALACGGRDVGVAARAQVVAARRARVKELLRLEGLAARGARPRHGGDVALFINHRHADIPMASTRAGTMKLTADPHLRVLASLDPDRSDVEIARSAVTRGELPQMSIGFNVPKDPRVDVWSADFSTRSIFELGLKEVSIVREGANPYTEASMRSVDEILSEMDGWSDAEIKRAADYLSALIPPAEVVEVVTDFAARDRADRERIERLLAARQPVV
jgi:HK97 family phage prohead protease